MTSASALIIGLWLTALRRVAARQRTCSAVLIASRLAQYYRRPHFISGRVHLHRYLESWSAHGSRAVAQQRTRRRVAQHGGAEIAGVDNFTELSWAAALLSCSRTEWLQLTWKTHVFCTAARCKAVFNGAWACCSSGRLTCWLLRSLPREGWRVRASAMRTR